MNHRRPTDPAQILTSVLDPARYAILGEISRGGMGVIMRAHDKELQRPVAIKIIRDKYTHSTGFARFLQEAQVMAHLNHPNIVQIHDIGQKGGYAYFVMELVEGHDYDSLVRSGRGAAPHWAFIAETFIKVAEALAHCHEQGLLHRDLKPQNILVENKTQRPVLIDFGLVKADRSESGRQLQLTGEGQTVGTPAFMSLEQLRAHNLGPPSDVWSLGATLFFALTKRAPYSEIGPVAIYQAMLKGPPPRPKSLRPDIPRWLDDICARCLDLDPKKRPSALEAAQFLRDNARSLDSQSSGSAVAYDAHSSSTPRSKLRRIVLIVLFTVFAGLGAVGLLEFGRRMSLGDQNDGLPVESQVLPDIHFANGILKDSVVTISEGREIKGLLRRRGQGSSRLLTMELKDQRRWRRIQIDENNRFSAQLESLQDPSEVPLRLRLRSGEITEYLLRFENPRAREAIDLEALLGSMTRLESLTRLPSPRFEAGRKTSYNVKEWERRESNPIRHVDDYAHFVAKRLKGNRREYILFDQAGIGVLSRIWLSDVFGDLCIYIDDLDDPFIVANVATLAKGQVKPFVAPFVFRAGRAFTLNFPFPYKRFCRVSVRFNTRLRDHNRLIKILRYAVDHRVYPVGTALEPIRKTDLTTKKNRILSVARQLTMPPTFSNEVVQSHIIERSKSKEVLQLSAGKRSKALTHLRFRMKKRRRQLLQDPLKVLLRVFCDKQQTVEVPLLAFFSAHPNMTPYQSRGTAIDKDGWLHCYWPMPFKRSLKVELVNLLDKSISVDVAHSEEDYFWSDQSLYFHAFWRANHQLSTRLKSMYPVAKMTDRGRYVGTLLSVVNPVASQWMFGNDEFQFDAHDIKRFNPGTETDAYFGFHLVKKMNSTQSVPRPNDQFINLFQFCNNSSRNTNEGLYSFARWHILDNIPFRKRLSLAFEQSHISSRVKVGYSSTCLYYGQRPEDNVPTRLIKTELSLPQARDLIRFAPVAKGEYVIEGETLFPANQKKNVYHRDTSTIFINQGKDVTVGAREDYYWSGEKELTWLARRKKAELRVPFKARPGRYEVKLRLTRYYKFGTHRLSINGSEPKMVKLYSPFQSPMEELSLGIMNLTASNTLTVQSVNMPSEIKKEHRLFGFGLDYIRLVPRD